MHVFATGSTAGPLRRAAQAFVLRQDEATVDVTVGSGGKLIPRMCEWREGDIFCCGSSSAMDAALMFGAVRRETIRPLGVRASAILVPNGNPADIHGLGDLTRSDVRVGVAIEGSLEWLWESVALRAGMLEGIRARITTVAEGSSDLMGVLAKREVDAAIGWASASLLAPERIETIPIHLDWASWRTTSIALTPWCSDGSWAEAFLHFLKSADGEEVFRKFGWRRLPEARSADGAD
jgi:accessory colonization factor AcfC